MQVVPPLAAEAIDILPNDALVPVGTVSAVVEGMLVIQASLCAVVISLGHKLLQSPP